MTAKALTPVQALATLVGSTFLLAGILGFIPGITSHYGDLELAGDRSNAKLLGIFQTSVLQNIVHMLFGITGLYTARTWSGARTFLVGGGIVYLGLWILGLLNGGGWIPVNTADNWLHFALGLGMVALGLVARRESSTR